MRIILDCVALCNQFASAQFSGAVSRRAFHTDESFGSIPTSAPLLPPPMHPRKPLPHAEQILRMQGCLRRLSTQLRNRYAEFFEATKGRRECALEVQLRHRLLDSTRDAVALAEACLKELRRQEALFYAPFKPGDRVVVEAKDNGIVKCRGHFLIVDICPDKRRDFHYEALEITKTGAIY